MIVITLSGQVPNNHMLVTVKQYEAAYCYNLVSVNSLQLQFTVTVTVNSPNKIILSGFPLYNYVLT
jgi:hypothetical protein